MGSARTDAVVVVDSVAAYRALGGAPGQPPSWDEAAVVSLSAFHGRGLFATAFQPGDPQAAVAAIEAVLGLLIEITFISYLHPAVLRPVRQVPAGRTPLFLPR